jgi:hypothetical protein
MELQKHGKNPCFSYISSSYQHVKFVHDKLKQYCTDSYQTIKRYEYFDKRTNKTYIRYTFKTKCLELFKPIYDNFYFNKIKIVQNIEINNIILLYWYIGDGEMTKQNGIIKLHTNSFTEKEVEYLCEKLKIYEARKTSKEDRFIISIPRKYSKIFLKNIGECPFDDYSHKWKYLEYKNKNIEKNGMKKYNFEEIVKDFKTNNYTIYELQKKYNVPFKSITHHFDTNNIKWLSKKLKPIIQYDSNGNFIKEWSSASEANKYNFNNSGISKCCRGERKLYKNFIWRFK